MQGQHRRCLPVVLALLVAATVVPLTPSPVSADSDYVASCTARLRDSPSTNGASLVSMPAGTVVTTTAIVTGEPWSATCVTSVSGSTWYAITAVNGTSVASLYGVSVAYAASGLFQLSTLPPPIPAVYLEGIDVSHYQGSIDWLGVAAAGKRFAVMKVTQGQAYVDPTYATNHAAARAAGLSVTAYHFADPSISPNDAILQATWYAQNAALLPGDLVPALDLEQTGGLSVGALQSWVAAWLGQVYATLGVRPMIYTSPNFWKNAMGDTTMFADQGYAVLWVAHWFTSSPTVPAANWGGRGWTFWQYSNCGSVTGIAGCVDLDRFNGSDLSAVAFNYTYIPPPPVVPPNLPPVLAAISPASAPAGTGDITISIQGEGFSSGVSAAYWNGMALATSYVSPTLLTAVVPSALTATPGEGSVTVLSQPPGGGTSAPAAFTVTLPAAQVGLTPTTNAIDWGGSVRVGIRVAPGAGRTATLQRRQANETQWADIGTLVTDGSGQATFDYRPPVNTWFQAVYAGSPDLGPGTSAPVRVVVRQAVVLRPTNAGRVRTVAAGTRITFTATVRPSGPTLAPGRATFQAWRLVGGRWTVVTRRTVPVDAAGRARWTWAFTTRGQWYVRALAEATGTNANSAWSTLERYSVR